MGDGDRERFELLYAAHYDRVLAYALSRAGVDVAREAASETFLVAWRRLGDLPQDPLPWLIGVARRCVADQRRSTARRDALYTRLRQRIDARPDWTQDPADAVAERDQVVTAIGRLPDLDRELLCLVAWDGLSAAQAAESLGCSRATFAVRLHRARRRLVAALAAGDAGAKLDGSGRQDGPALGAERSLGEAAAPAHPAMSRHDAARARLVPHSAPVFTRVRLAGASMPATSAARLADPPANVPLSVRPEEAS